MSDHTLISARNISRYYGTQCALDDVSFSARKGEITGFLGPNGAGKSTLMQIVCGVLAPSTGSISISGHDMLETPLAAKEKMGYLPEQPPLYPDCTVDEYLRFCARLRRIAATEITGALQRSKDRCGLTAVGRRPIGGLSKGYQQRVGLAQAIIHAPDVLILDEPGSGLDPSQIVDMRKLISEIGQDHCVIFSTHILAEAQSICDRIMILNRGRIVLDTSLDQLQLGESGATIIVSFRTPPASTEQLAKVPGVKGLTDSGNNTFRILAEDVPSVSAAIAEVASINHWGLLELRPDTGGLEKTYIELTQMAPERVEEQSDDT